MKRGFSHRTLCCKILKWVMWFFLTNFFFLRFSGAICKIPDFRRDHCCWAIALTVNSKHCFLTWLSWAHEHWTNQYLYLRLQALLWHRNRPPFRLHKYLLVKHSSKRVRGMMFGLEMAALTKTQEAKLEMLRISLGVSWMDRIRNQSTRGTAQVEWFADKVRETVLRWLRHVQRGIVDISDKGCWR